MVIFNTKERYGAVAIALHWIMALGWPDCDGRFRRSASNILEFLACGANTAWHAPGNSAVTQSRLRCGTNRFRSGIDMTAAEGDHGDVFTDRDPDDALRHRAAVLAAATASVHAQSALDKLKNVVDALQVRDISGAYTYTARGFAGSGIAKVEQSGRDVRILATWLPVGGGPHYEMRGKLSGNTIEGQWYSYYHRRAGSVGAARFRPAGSSIFRPAMTRSAPT